MTAYKFSISPEGKVAFAESLAALGAAGSAAVRGTPDVDTNRAVLDRIADSLDRIEALLREGHGGDMYAKGARRAAAR